MNKSTRKIKAKETLSIVEAGSYLLENGTKIQIKKEVSLLISNTKFFDSEELKKLNDTIKIENDLETTYEVTSEKIL